MMDVSSFEVSTTFEIKILLQINIDSINIQVDLNDSNATLIKHFHLDNFFFNI